MACVYDVISACLLLLPLTLHFILLQAERMERLHTFLILLFLFCSPGLSAGTTFLTHLGTPCEEDCKPDGGEYKCKTIDEDGRSQSLYCSPQENMDYWGRQCRADSMCGKHGEEDFYWCRVNVFTWGYCGLVKDDNNITESGVTQFTPRRRNKRQVVFDTKDDTGNHIRTTFSQEPAPRHIADIGNLRNEAENLIGTWNNGYLGNQARSNLIHTANLRIDMQGIINHNNLPCYNLQIQKNTRRRPGESTTVSQIIVSQTIEPAERYIRRAFFESLNRRARVFLIATRYNNNY